MSRPRSHFILAPFEGCAIHITPPLTISEEEIKGLYDYLRVMDEVLMTIEK
jgi:4-aminobutyrate aminotransferase-like enzyme